MVKRRKEEDIAGILEFAGRTSEDPEFLEWLAQARGEKVRLIPVDPSNTKFSITACDRVLAQGDLRAAQHELPEFPGEDSKEICRRYLSQLESLVAECHEKFAP